MKVFEMLLIIGMIFLVPISIISSNIQMYLIFLPSAFILFSYVYFINKNRLKMTQVVLIYVIFIVFFITSFEHGISFNDIISVSGISLIPLLILIYIKKDHLSFFRYFIFFFLLYEVFIIFIIFYYGIWFDGHGNLLIIRKYYSWAFPNYFAMLSAIKIGTVSYLRKNNQINNSSLYSFHYLISLVIIGTSLSRTAMLMTLIVLIFPIILNESGPNKRKNIFGKILLVAIISPIGLYAINLKNSNVGSTVNRTISERYERWDILLEIIKDQPLFGIGYRSVTDFAVGIGSSHNDYLDILVKGGIISFIMLYGYFFYRAYILYKKKEITLFSIMLSIFIAGLTQNPLKFLPIMAVFSVVIAISYKKELLE